MTNYINRKFIISQISIFGVFVSMIISLYLTYKFFIAGANNININWYVWGSFGTFQFKFGCLLDKLSVIMLSMISIIALVVQVYSLEYMRKEKEYVKFFISITLFTFAMDLLVIANNFFQLFVAWELVSLSSYLLIGFWNNRDLANNAALKAFLINRIGDLGLLLAIALIFVNTNSLDYIVVFKNLTVTNNQLVNLISILLFISVIVKSAQIPLHIWLPDSMEAPTPVSALIHAATMVAAGVFLLARMSPILEYSEYCLNIILFVGSITAFFIGILAVIEKDIKKILAYSTISQLGIMIASMGVSSYDIGIFHLINHGFLKALLFLGAGSIILAANHMQDINNISVLKKHLPITYWCMLIGCLALSGVPGFSGYFSKSLILKSVALSKLPCANNCYYLLLFSVWLTGFYSLRLIFTVFHKSKPNLETNNYQESTKIITIPLIILTVFAALLGGILAKPILSNTLFNNSIFILSNHNILKDSLKYSLFNHVELGVFLAMAIAFIIYIQKPHLSKTFKQILHNDFLWLHNILQKQYFFNELNQKLVTIIRFVAKVFANIIDQWVIDKSLVNSVSCIIVGFSKTMQKMQTGHLSQYLFVMLTGVLIILLWLILNVY